jgi:hypothetical protein
MIIHQEGDDRAKEKLFSIMTLLNNHNAIRRLNAVSHQQQHVCRVKKMVRVE